MQGTLLGSHARPDATQDRGRHRECAGERSGRDGELLTVDELAAATGPTVRTTRYYAGLGLIPPPTRRGRMAFYSAEHRARLELIRALQDHGFTLAAIEKYLSRVPEDASVEDLAVQRVMLTSWKSGATRRSPAASSRRESGVSCPPRRSTGWRR